jgi:hypothetical protein
VYVANRGACRYFVIVAHGWFFGAGKLVSKMENTGSKMFYSINGPGRISSGVGDFAVRIIH